MLEKAIVINGEADYPTAKRLAARKGGAPIYSRTDISGKKVAKELIVVGGTKDGLIADKFTVLSGEDFFGTVAAVKKYLG